MTRLFDRRDFLRAAGAAFVAGLAPGRAMALAGADALFATAFQRRDGRFGVGVLTEAGKLVHAIDLPDRGHDVTFDPVSRRSVVFARQPGTFMVVFDHARATSPVTVASTAGRHFYGHGAFAPDGRLLYATENDYDNAAGLIGVYDATDGFARIGEFPSYGVGPHEVLLSPDGRTLAIANGGIETHPDFGRAELNLATMKPSLVLVDRLTGDLIARHELDGALHQLSIRHLDFDGAATLWFGCQHRGPTTERPPLVGRLSRGGEPDLVAMPDDVLAGLRNYVGSVATNHEAGTVAVSSPQGNSFALLDAASGKVLAKRDLTEVCGLAADRAGYLATTGTGAIVAPDMASVSDPDFKWDNHLMRIG